MSEQEPNEQPSLNPPENEDSSESERERRSRPRTLTSEQRRLLGKPRPLHERMEAEKEIIDEPAPADEPAEPTARQHETWEPHKPGAADHAGKESAEPKSASEEP